MIKEEAMTKLEEQRIKLQTEQANEILSKVSSTTHLNYTPKHARWLNVCRNWDQN